MNYSCCIFDLDGTLSDPLVGMAAALNHALREHGHPEQTTDYLGQFVGPPLEGTLTALTGCTEDAQLSSLVQTYREHYVETGFSQNSLYPGIPELLQALKKDDVTLGVCTSKPESIARKILSLFELDHYFSFVSGGDVGVVKGQQLERLLQVGEIDNRALMIGDRSVDVIAAHSNNLASAGVLWGFGSKEELTLEQPHHVLEQPAHLLDVLRVSA
ncbi:MAG: HAD hydrolase-like protein [Gammaproteobacteria bacterium]|nr:HAD hydrolase-like protein [Gammaproteobacteria bacterium]